MLTLSYGFKKPETSDKGGVFFPALSLDMQLLNDHTHDGSNSSKMTTRSSVAVTKAISAASWVALGGGLYSQRVSMPASLLWAETLVQIKDTDGDVYFLTLEKVAGLEQFDVYCNDNTLDLVAYFAS
jgi:hypothetical protein